MKIDESKILKFGEWLYNGTTTCRIVITREEILPGSGDYEDSPEISNDKNVSCVQIWYENPSTYGDFNASGGYLMTVEDAVRKVENTLRCKIKWQT